MPCSARSGWDRSRCRPACEFVELLNITEPRVGRPLMAYAWLRSEPPSGYGKSTAMNLVRMGHADRVHEWILPVNNLVL